MNLHHIAPPNEVNIRKSSCKNPKDARYGLLKKGIDDAITNWITV